ncbi:glutathione S-transferase family protein [Salinisphaera aquimarina]|uniref:Glutathione S-transferase family protein n=1 Tax=Salinisphaera aquimarina TaxID=2094031 RepID=A0ABV7ELY0_9GAMM
MKLLGSGTSPFVRRIRLLLGDTPCEFASMDIYGADRDQLRRHNPALKIPMLIDGDNGIYDSRVIARYLADKMALAPLSWAQENQLTLIDAVNDSGVTLALSKRSGIDIAADVLFYNLQHERIRLSLDALSEQAAAGAFDDWHYPAMCVYALVDWMELRDLFDFSAHQPLLEVRQRHRQQPMVAETDPRNAG